MKATTDLKAHLKMSKDNTYAGLSLVELLPSVLISTVTICYVLRHKRVLITLHSDSSTLHQSMLMASKATRIYDKLSLQLP